jgi:hypothetical protein
MGRSVQELPRSIGRLLVYFRLLPRSAGYEQIPETSSGQKNSERDRITSRSTNTPPFNTDLKSWIQNFNKTKNQSNSKICPCLSIHIGIPIYPRTSVLSRCGRTGSPLFSSYAVPHAEIHPYKQTCPSNNRDGHDSQRPIFRSSQTHTSRVACHNSSVSTVGSRLRYFRRG